VDRDLAQRSDRPLTAPLAALSLALLGCGGAPSEPRASAWNAPPQGVRAASSGTRAERYFPLVDGYVYLYATAAEGGEGGLLVARVRRSSERAGELRFPSGAARFQYTAEGVVRVEPGAFVLKEPLEVGTTWPGEHGGKARIIAVDVTIEVPAGRFSGCVQTLEERLGDRPARYVSTFCPDVGVVSLEAAGGASYEKAALNSYAPPVDIGPDGVVRTPATE
jgi:hypothetical protein